MTPRRANLWARDGLYVDVHLTADGDLIINGQDLSGAAGAAEYEYSLTVPAAEVPRVVAGLGGQPGDDVIPLLSAHATTIVETGELTWLRSLAIEPEFWSRVDM